VAKSVKQTKPFACAWCGHEGEMNVPFEHGRRDRCEHCAGWNVLASPTGASCLRVECGPDEGLRVSVVLRALLNRIEELECENEAIKGRMRSLESNPYGYGEP